MDQILHHVVGSRMPIHVSSLVRSECLERLLQLIAKLIAHQIIRLDNGIAIRVKSRYQTGLNKVSRLVAQLSNAL